MKPYPTPDEIVDRWSHALKSRPVAMTPYPTAEEVAPLFAKWKITPSQDDFLDVREPCGCAVGVLLVDAVGSITKAVGSEYCPIALDAPGSLRIATGWPEDFIDGLSRGFSSPYAKPTGVSIDYKAGHALGKAVWKLVRPRKRKEQAS
jgi:hypothetical protein